MSDLVRTRRRLLAVLPRGEAIRNFVYSGALDQLSPSTQVAVASVDPSPQVFADLEARFERVHRLSRVDERLPVRLARSVLDQAHGRHLWSEAAQERWRRRQREATSTALRARRAGWHGLARALATPRGVEAANRLERAASRRFPPSDEAERLIDSEAPDLVFNGSHIHSAIAIPLVQAARWARISTSTFLFSWDNLTSQGRILDIYDHYLAWNQTIADDLVRMYPKITADQVRVTGTPQFDFHFHDTNRWQRERWAETVGVDASRPVVLYTTGMPNHMPGEPEIVELLADQLTAMTGHGPPQLLVRVYAKDRSGRFDDLRSRRPDIAFSPVPWLTEWLTPLPEDTGLWTSTLDQVVCGVNVASTVSLELCMFDKPAVNVAFNPPSVPRAAIDYARYYRFDHYRPLVENGAVDLVRSPEEMARSIRGAFDAPEAAAADRARILEKMFGDTLDGHSADRVAAALLTCMGVSAR